jgi:carbon-monoxide dehydrogenase medium subunit
LRIGAGARHRDIELSPIVKRHYPLLHETFRKVAQPRIRNMGTVGGNLAAGDPLTDPGASLIALDGEVVLTSSQGQRVMRLDEFFVDYYQTALNPGELLTEIRVPPPERLGWSHIKFTPRSVEDFATVGVALTLSAKNGVCEDVRLGLNSVASTIIHAKRAEEAVRGKTITDATLREMGEVAASEVDPMDDNRGSADYKREMVKVLVPRAAQEAFQRAS